MVNGITRARTRVIARRRFRKARDMRIIAARTKIAKAKITTRARIARARVARRFR